MNITEHLLTTLGEEGAEVSQGASKCLRFGVNDVYPSASKNPDNKTSRERLICEVNELIAVAEILETHGVFPPNWMSRDIINAKKLKVIAMMQYAKDCGTLEKKP
jgi:hypothetical protein